MRFLVLVWLPFVFAICFGCATQHVWQAGYFSGTTISDEGPLGEVEIFLEGDTDNGSRPIGKSDGAGSFVLQPIGRSRFCFLLGCLGDPKVVRANYVFVKAGYRSSEYPREFLYISAKAPEFPFQEVILKKGE